MKPPVPETFAAFVGLDWADAKHDICLQVAGSTRREFLRLEHRPEVIAAWVCTLRTRFNGQPIAICLELNKGPMVSALQNYEFLVLFPVNPLTVAKYRVVYDLFREFSDPTIGSKRGHVTKEGVAQRSRPWEKAPTFLKAHEKAQQAVGQRKRTARKKA